MKIYLIFSEMLFTVCAHDSFILGQQMGFLKGKIKLQQSDEVEEKTLLAKPSSNSKYSCLSV